ncbi:HEAT repeat domain-containing protein [Kamptonema sp. UHCC 0994]|uniref:HEAT repeat domain-containing protein n=1 Tax=Kamptonema sp. UHCC 0994 TaxID=3031329 RepID=UPI0023B8C73F|nr:HEAT repeat domain-containing protein [Kamptonema sp. UHCC 0994]MDF0554261.1 HEAT repeat domain-containing protein [Kamptonema sp. UHCC 0994]
MTLARLLVRLSIFSTVLAGASFIPGMLPATVMVGGMALASDPIKTIFTALASVSGGNVANAVDALTGGKPDPLSLENEDLTKAVGRAIGAVIKEAAKDYNRDISHKLTQIAVKAENNWLEIARREISKHSYQELMENQLDEFLTAEGESLTKKTALMVETWEDIFALLNMAAKAGGGFQLDSDVHQQIATLLYTKFPEKLREVLKDDFERNGKAYAGLTLSLLTDIKAKLNQQEETNQQIIQLLESRFAEVRGYLKPEDFTPVVWREISRRMFAEREQKTTTSFFDKIAGFTPNFDDIYVPLALVEKQVKPQAEANITPETGSAAYREKPTQEIETKISEDDFFNLLRSGKSPKSQGRRIAIIGEPGAGKTTRLQKIAKWIFEENLGLPIWIDLRELGGKSIEQYLKETWLFKATGIESHWQGLIAQFNQGQVWLLLDGLDEMTAMANSQELLKLQGWVSKARVIVSCRTNVWDGGSFGNSDYDLFRNQDFAPEQVQAFIRNWFEQAKHPQVGEFLLGKLAQPEHQRLADLIRNPLRLTLFCLNGLAYQEKGGLPETQAALYEAFVEQFYLANNAKNQPDLRTDKNQQGELNKVLAELSLWAMTRSSSRFLIRPSELSPELKQKLGGEDVNNWLVCRLGWLNCVGVDPQNPQQWVYGFYHATFQEYFAALGVKNGWCFFEGNRIFDREWKQIILLWLGRKDVSHSGRKNVSDEQKEELIQALIEFEDGCGEWHQEEVDKGFYEYRAYFLAAAGIVEFKFGKSEEIVNQIVRWGFGYFNEEKQKWVTYLDPLTASAREVLKETNRGRAIELLVNLLANSDDEYTRRQAAYSLGKIDPGNQEAIAALVNLLETTEDENIRRQTTYSLGKIGPSNQEEIVNLVNLLANSNDEFTRRQTAYSLGEIGTGNPEAITSLVNLLATTEDEDTRWEAAYSLGKIGIGNEKAIADLVDLLATTKNKNIRMEAAYSLGKIIETNEQYAYVVSQLQPHLSDETYQNNFELFDNCYHVLWQCAQNLPYHQFYQLWNQQPHPATLPLGQRLKNHPPLNQYQWLLIDGSKFIDRDNPALDIYGQMLAANYPESSQKLPETMQLFGFYWSQLQRNQTAPILIFYEDPAPRLPQGFSKVFLTALSRLAGKICVISNEVDLCVKTFAPSHPNLEKEICQWIEE